MSGKLKLRAWDKKNKRMYYQELLRKNKEDMKIFPLLCYDCICKSLESMILDSYCDDCRREDIGI